jgi:hypothetical protein
MQSNAEKSNLPLLRRKDIRTEKDVLTLFAVILPSSWISCGKPLGVPQDNWHEQRFKPNASGIQSKIANNRTTYFSSSSMSRLIKETFKLPKIQVVCTN